MALELLRIGVPRGPAKSHSSRCEDFLEGVGTVKMLSRVHDTSSMPSSQGRVSVTITVLRTSMWDLSKSGWPS